MRESQVNSPDRRQAPRTKLVQIAYLGMGPENGGLVLDVSEGGLSFHAVSPVRQAEKIQFILSLRGHSRIEGAGEVVWTNEMKTVCGMKFTSLSSAAREHLINWTNESKTATPAHEDIDPPAPQAQIAAPEKKYWGMLTEPAFSNSPDFIAPVTDPEQMPAPFWQKPYFLWILFAILSSVFAGSTYFYGVKVGKSEVNQSAQSVPKAIQQSIAPSAQTAPVAPISTSEAANSAPASVPPEPTSAASVPNKVTPAPSGAFQNTSKTDDTSEGSGQSRDAGGNSAAAREQRAEQQRQAGQSELAAAQGYLIGTPNGVHDSAAAARLLWSAVGRGNSTAEVVLAELYLRGDGVPRSCEQGRILLTAARKSGNPEAAEKLRELNVNGCR
jgi:PilZ domain-containing protein